MRKNATTKTETGTAPRYEPETLRLLVVIRAALRAHPWQSLADLSDEVKTQCSRHRLPWSPERLSEAFRIVGTGTLVREPLPPPEPPPRTVRDGRPYGKGEAAILLAQIAARLRTTGGPKTIKPAAYRDRERDEADHAAARERAYLMGINLDDDV